MDDGKDWSDDAGGNKPYEQVSHHKLAKHMGNGMDHILGLLALFDGKEIKRRHPQLVLRGEHEKYQEGDEHHRHHEGVNRADAPQQKLLIRGFLL